MGFRNEKDKLTKMNSFNIQQMKELIEARYCVEKAAMTGHYLTIATEAQNLPHGKHRLYPVSLYFVGKVSAFMLKHETQICTVVKLFAKIQ
jgi:hypothetical protein